MAHLRNKHQGFIPNDVTRQNDYMTYIPRLIEEREEKKERQRKQKEKTSRDEQKQKRQARYARMCWSEVEIPANLLKFCWILFFIICVFTVEFFYFFLIEKVAF